MFVTVIVLSFSAFAGEETLIKNRYFILHIKEDVAEARLCDLYIRDDYILFRKKIDNFDVLYKNKSISELQHNLEDIKFRDYEQHLLTCSGYFRYESGVNYFREAHSKLLLIIAIVEMSLQKRDFNTPVSDLIDALSVNLKGIVNSERIVRN